MLFVSFGIQDFISKQENTFPNHDGILRLDHALVSPEYFPVHHRLLDLSLSKSHIENHRTILKPPLFPFQGLLRGVVCRDVCRDVRWHFGYLDKVSLSLYWDAWLPHVLADTRPGTGLFINWRSSSFPPLPWLPRALGFVSSSLPFYLCTCPPSSLFSFLSSFSLYYSPWSVSPCERCRNPSRGQAKTPVFANYR